MTAAASSAGATQIDWEGGDLILTRVFPAPREVVYAAWTHPEHFARWWGPHDSTTRVRTMEVRPGGALHFCHQFADDEIWIGGTYREVRAPERIAFTTFFSDADGGLVRLPGYPDEMTITVSFAERDGGTQVTARHVGLPADNGEVQGWTEGLDRLHALLAGG